MSQDNHKRYAIILDPSDNVATLIHDVSPGEQIALKGANGTVSSREEIRLGHKIALRPIGAGERIIKYGQQIGCAIRDISEGEWVHLHNMASVLDATFRKRVEP